jgi:hypothetical protein
MPALAIQMLFDLLQDRQKTADDYVENSLKVHKISPSKTHSTETWGNLMVG